MSNKPKLYPDNPPKMLISVVCFVDVLGFSQLSMEAIQNGDEQKFLIKLSNALSKAYERIREHSKGWDDSESFNIKVFTDNVVVGYPNINN
jgi:Tfp pilus assembly protein PilV